MVGKNIKEVWRPFSLTWEADIGEGSLVVSESWLEAWVACAEVFSLSGRDDRGGRADEEVDDRELALGIVEVEILGEATIFVV